MLNTKNKLIIFVFKILKIIYKKIINIQNFFHSIFYLRFSFVLWNDSKINNIDIYLYI